MECPICSCKDLGKIGRKKYFCPNCCTEILIQSNVMKIISLTKKGVAKVTKTILLDANATS